MTSFVAGSNSVQLPISDLENVFTYDGDFISTITVVYRGLTYIQSFTNDGTNITSISPFMVQP